MDMERQTLSERSGRALIDDLNRNITLLRQVAKGYDRLGPSPGEIESDLKVLANSMVALCLTLRSVIQAQGLQSVRSE